MPRLRLRNLQRCVSDLERSPHFYCVHRGTFLRCAAQGGSGAVEVLFDYASSA